MPSFARVLPSSVALLEGIVMSMLEHASPLVRAMFLAALAYASGRRVLLEVGELRLINGRGQLACPEVEEAWDRCGDRLVTMALGVGVPIVLGHRDRACAAGWPTWREVPS